MSTPQLRSDFHTWKPYKYYKFKRVWKSDRAVPATQNGRVNDNVNVEPVGNLKHKANA